MYNSVVVPEKTKPTEIINPESIIVATSTFYPNWDQNITDANQSISIRGKLALETIGEAVKKGYQVIVVDGGSGSSFTSKAKDLGAVVFNQNEDGMSPGRRQAFREAAKLLEAKIICWTEPEKISIVKDCLPKAIIPILLGEADIVVPKRDEGSFLTYPKYQAKIEKQANQLWNKILRKNGLLPNTTEDIDIWFGPKFFKNDSKILSLFLARYGLAETKSGLYKNANPEDWANATMLPIITALKEGFRVKSVLVSYIHPSEQTRLEENNESFDEKRRQQFRSIIAISSEFVKFIKGNPKSLIRNSLD